LNRGQVNDKINDIMKLNEYIEITNEDNMDLMARYPDKYFDLAIIDPPYGINAASWDLITDRPKKEYWYELFRVSKNQIVFGANYFTDNLPITKSWLVWDKTIRGKSYLKNRSEFELIWTSIKTNPAIFNYTIDGNIEGFDGGRPDYNKKKAIHPTQKPTAVYEFLFKHFATEGMKILDTHFGSGSIAIAVHEANIIDKMDLSLVACELDKDYFESSIQRVKAALQTQSLF
jgi:site-specific DNA-methyltransferase (adenine-specific)